MWNQGIISAFKERWSLIFSFVLAIWVLASAALWHLYFMPMQNQENKAQLVINTERMSAYISSYFESIQNRLLASALNPNLQKAVADSLLSNDMSKIKEVINALLVQFPGATALKYFPKGTVSVNLNAQPPVGYTVLEMIRRSELGQRPVPAFFAFKNNWYLNFSTPVLNPITFTGTIGSIWLVYPEQTIRDKLSVLLIENEGLILEQTINEHDGKSVIELGKIDRNAHGRHTASIKIGNISVQLFSPGVFSDKKLTIWFWFFSIFLLFIVTVVCSVSISHVLKVFSRDLSLLLSYLKDALAQGEAQIPRFSLGVFRELVQSLIPMMQKSDQVKQAPKTESNTNYIDPVFLSENAMEVEQMDENLSNPNEDTPELSRTLPKVVPESVFRAYDIRGIVGETLTNEFSYALGLSIGSQAYDQGESTVVVACDGRESSPSLKSCLIEGLRASGRNVIDIGCVPTPVLYFATHQLPTNTGVMVTGSHNPSNYNGYKIVIAGKTLAGAEIQRLRQRIERAELLTGEGSLQKTDLKNKYIQTIVDDVVIARPMKIVADCGNGVAGVIVEDLFHALGVELIPLYCNVDGRFPNHHPDPSRPENLLDLQKKVAETGADLGFAFDGDGDRLGVITESGKIVWPDQYLQLFAEDVLSRNPGADILFDVKCSKFLIDHIKRSGGRPVMCQTGHSLVKSKMKELGALLAGEMSGHIFFKERWFGFDDGLYSAARLLEILSTKDSGLDDWFQTLPYSMTTPELNVAIDEEKKFQVIKKLQHHSNMFELGQVTTIDGVRVDYEDGWGLVRASNTTPVLVLRFEAKDEQSMLRIKSQFFTLLCRIDASLTQALKQQLGL